MAARKQIDAQFDSIFLFWCTYIVGGGYNTFMINMCRITALLSTVPFGTQTCLAGGSLNSYRKGWCVTFLEGKYRQVFYTWCDELVQSDVCSRTVGNSFRNANCSCEDETYMITLLWTNIDVETSVFDRFRRSCSERKKQQHHGFFHIYCIIYLS